MKQGVEIERKFLVRRSALPPLPSGHPIAQAYLGFDPVVRVRVQGDRGFLTVKGKGLLCRREVEVEIGADAARALLDLRAPESVVIRKTRHLLLWGGHIWEVDWFEEPFSGLVMAEVELASETEVVDLPPWAAEEVTANPAYQNASLARQGKAP